MGSDPAFIREFRRRKVEVGEDAALVELCEKARAQGAREVGLACPGECCNPICFRLSYLVSLPPQYRRW